MYIGEITELSAPGCGLGKETFNFSKCTCPCKWARNWSIFCLIKSNQSLVPIIWIHYLLSSGGYASIERFLKKTLVAVRIHHCNWISNTEPGELELGENVVLKSV